MNAPYSEDFGNHDGSDFGDDGSPDELAELARVNRLKNRYVKDNGTLDGFEEHLALEDHDHA